MGQVTKVTRRGASPSPTPPSLCIVPCLALSNHTVEVQVALPSSRARSAAGRGTGSGPCGSPGAPTDWESTLPRSSAAAQSAARPCSAARPERPALGQREPSAHAHPACSRPTCSEGLGPNGCCWTAPTLLSPAVPCPRMTAHLCLDSGCPQAPPRQESSWAELLSTHPSEQDTYGSLLPTVDSHGQGQQERTSRKLSPICDSHPGFCPHRGRRRGSELPG